MFHTAVNEVITLWQNEASSQVINSVVSSVFDRLIDSPTDMPTTELPSGCPAGPFVPWSVAHAATGMAIHAWRWSNQGVRAKRQHEAREIRTPNLLIWSQTRCRRAIAP